MSTLSTSQCADVLRAEEAEQAELSLLTEIICNEGVVVRSRRGEFLYRQQDQMAHIYLMKSGLAAVTRICKSGNRQVLDFVLPDHILPVIRGSKVRSNHAVECLTDVVSCIISEAALLRQLRDSPGPLRAAFRVAARSVDHAYINLTNMGCRQGHQRVAYALSEVHQRWMASRGNASEGIPIRQVDLADAVGVTKVYVNQILKRLEKDDIVKLEKASITVVDSVALAEKSDYELQV